MLLLGIVASDHSSWMVTLLGSVIIKTGQELIQFVEVVSWQFFLYIIGERARHSQVCSIENRIYVYIWYVQILFL